MSDPIETVVETATRGITIDLDTFAGRTLVTTVASLTAYGAVSAARDAKRKVEQIRENRKAKKTLKEQPPAPQQ